jgi:hypothetical protein
MSWIIKFGKSMKKWNPGTSLIRMENSEPILLLNPHALAYGTTINETVQG